jgi:putative hydrolase of the HAD superfamily
VSPEAKPKLHCQPLSTGVLPNTPPELVADTRKMAWTKGFEPLYFSAEIMANKPYEPTYTNVVNDPGCSPNETLFVDDRADNVRGARRADLNAVVHTSLEETRRLVELEFEIPLP